MSDDTIRLVTIGRIIRRRWRVLALYALVGALVGYGASALFPPRYTTSASVLLPGTWEERGLLTQTEVATSSTVVDRAAATLGWTGVSGSDLRDQSAPRPPTGTSSRSRARPTRRSARSGSPTRWPRSSSSYATRIAGESADPAAAQELAALQQ